MNFLEAVREAKKGKRIKRDKETFHEFLYDGTLKTADKRDFQLIAEDILSEDWIVVDEKPEVKTTWKKFPENKPEESVGRYLVKCKHYSSPIKSIALWFSLDGSFRVHDIDITNQVLEFCEIPE